MGIIVIHPETHGKPSRVINVSRKELEAEESLRCSKLRAPSVDELRESAAIIMGVILISITLALRITVVGDGMG